jgi:hypothetical protein
MQACAAACASWLLREGFFTNPFDDGCGPTAQPPDVITRLERRINEDGNEKARAVQTVLMWLDWQVLPALDGRRSASRQRLRESPPHATVPDPEGMAELLFGETEELLAAKIRSIVASQEALRPVAEMVLTRQIQRAELARQPAPPELAHWYRRWLADGEALLRVVLSTGPTGRRVPRTLSEWQSARALFEADLKKVGFTPAEVLELLPGGGGQRALFARGRRARNRATG